MWLAPASSIATVWSLNLVWKSFHPFRLPFHFRANSKKIKKLKTRKKCRYHTWYNRDPEGIHIRGTCKQIGTILAPTRMEGSFEHNKHGNSFFQLNWIINPKLVHGMMYFRSIQVGSNYDTTCILWYWVGLTYMFERNEVDCKVQEAKRVNGSRITRRWCCKG